MRSQNGFHTGMRKATVNHLIIAPKYISISVTTQTESVTEPGPWIPRSGRTEQSHYGKVSLKILNSTIAQTGKESGALRLVLGSENNVLKLAKSKTL